MSVTPTPTADTKPWYQSVTVWASVISIVAVVVGALLHKTIDADTQNSLASLLAELGGVVAGAIAIWGRLRATTTIAPSK